MNISLHDAISRPTIVVTGDSAESKFDSIRQNFDSYLSLRFLGRWRHIIDLFIWLWNRVALYFSATKISL